MRDRLVQGLLSAEGRTGATVGAAALAPIVICAVCYALRDEVSAASGALLLVLVVVVAAVTSLRLAAFAAAISGGVWFDFFLTRPRLSFTIAKGDDVVVTVLLVVTGAIVSELVIFALQRQAEAARRSGYLAAAMAAAEAVARSEMAPTELVRLVSTQIADVLGVPVCRYVDGPLHDSRVAVLDHDGALLRGGREVDVDRAGLPTDEEVAIAVTRGDDVVGHFLMNSASRIARPGEEQRRVALLLADLVAAGTSGPR